MAALEPELSGTAPAEAAAGRAVVCDDDPVAREVVGTVLQESGFAVSGEAANGAELIQLCEWVKPDVVIVDNALIGMSGLETIPAVRALLPDAVIVMLSAFDSALAEATSVGADLAVDKMEVGELAHRINARITALREAKDGGPAPLA